MANFFPDELIAEIVNANDLVSVASSYVQLKKSGRDYMACCPFHREKTPSFHISADKQLYHCFGCGAGGSVIQFVMAAENLDFPDAIRFLAQKAGINVPESDSEDSTDEFYNRKRRIYEMNRDAARFFREVLLSPQGKSALEYLTSRGLSMKTITSFGLGASPDSWDSLLKRLTSLGYERDLIVEAGLCVRNEKNHVYDRYRNRVIFPIIDVRGNVVGFGGRRLSDDGAKYINSSESIVYNKSKILYALNFAKKNAQNYIILTEGYMDVISLHQAGFTTAVAGCGTALTPDQARLIARYTKNVYLCYDSDEAGQKAAKRAIEIFSPLDCNVKVLKVPDGKDPDEFIQKHGPIAFEKLISSARATAKYQIDSLMNQFDLDDISQKVEFSKNVAVLLSKLKSAIEQDEYVKYVCLKANISENALISEIKKLRYRDSKKEITGEMKKALAPTSALSPSDRPKVITRLKKAQSGLLCAILSSRAVFSKFLDKVTIDMFSEEIHKEIYQKAIELYNNNVSFGITELSSHFLGRESEFSEVFLTGDQIADPMKAANDYINVIEKEIIKNQIAKATAANDTKALSQLLQKQKSLKG